MHQFKYVVGVMFAAILVYSGLWYTAAFDAEKEVAATFSKWRDLGLQIEHGRIEHGGFPYRITVNVRDFKFATRGKGLVLAAEDILLVTHLWTPNHWIAEAKNVTGSAADRSTSFSDGFIHGSYRIHDTGKALIVVNSLTVDDFEFSKLLGQQAPILTDWELAFQLDDPSLNKTETGLYGQRYLDFKLSGKSKDQELVLTGGISGPVIKDWTTEEIGPWRDEGGLIEFDNVDYLVPGGRTKGSASFTLDENFRPLGSASLLRSGEADLKRLIKGFGLKPKGMENSRGPTSLMLQNGRVSLDGNQIAKLKPVID